MRLLDSFHREATHKIHINLQKDALATTQPAITCSKLTIETQEQGVKYVQS